MKRLAILDIAASNAIPGSVSTVTAHSLVGFHFHFETPYQLGQKLVAKTKNGYVTILDRDLDGDSGYVELESPLVLNGRANIHLRPTSDAWARIRLGIVVEGVAADYEPRMW